MTELTALLSEMFWALIVQVTLVILLVGTTARLFLRNRPFPALVLWTVVLVKCIAPPVVYSPSGVFCWIDTRSSAAERTDGTPDAQVLPASSTGESGLVAIGAEMIDDVAAIANPVGEGTSTDTVQWHFVVVVIWLAGALGLLVANGIRTVRFLRRLKTEVVAPDASLDRLVRRLSRYVGLRRPPRVVISKSNVGPAVFGVLRPTILLPAALVQNDRPRQLAPIVLHELTHLQRGDLWLALYSMLVRAIWWFHPLVWWSVRQAEWESERCCDESVVAFMRRDPARYAHSLIDALGQSHRLQGMVVAPGVRPVDITATRLERIMNLRHGSHRRMPMSCWILAFLAAALTLPGAAGTFAQPRETDEAVAQSDLPRAKVAPENIDPNEKPAGFKALTKTAAADSKTVRVYAVADLLQKMKEEEAWPNNTSDEQIKLALLGFFRVCSPGIHAAARLPSAAQLPPSLFSASSPGIRAAIPPPSAASLSRGLAGEAEFRWHGDQLVVAASKAVHDSFAEEIELRRQHSFRQVTVEVRIMQGDPSLCTPSDDAEDVDAPADWRGRWVLFQQEFANLESEPHLEELVKASAQDQANVRSRQAAVASSATSNPIVHQFASDQQMRSFISGLENDARANILQAPKITLYDGQTALISDTTRRPFVTDVLQVVGDNGVAYKPVIKVLWEGTKIQLSPAIKPHGYRIKCRIMFADIKDCMQFRLLRYPDAQDIRIQHPVASTSSFECSIDIPSGQTLLIGGLFPAEREYNAAGQSMMRRLLGQTPKKVVRKEMTYIAITPRTVESE